MSLHPQRSWTYQSAEPQPFVPPEQHLKRTASIPAFPVPQLYPPNGAGPYRGPFLNQPHFQQPGAFPTQPPAFNAPYFPPNGGVPPHMRPPIVQQQQPSVPVPLPTSLGGTKPKLPKKPTPGGLGLYKIEDTPRAPLKQEDETFSDDERAPHGFLRKPPPQPVSQNRGSNGNDDAIEKVQLQMADKLWLEEQERQKKQVEEERRKYERDLANGVSQRPPVPRSSSDMASESGYESRKPTQNPYAPHAQYPAKHPYVPADPQPPVTTSASLLPPNPPLQPRPISTEEREQAKRNALRVVMEEHLKAQEDARRQAEYLAERKAAAEAERIRQEKERKERERQEAEAERLKEQREREKFEEECRRVQELQDTSMHSEQEALQRETMRRAEMKRWQLRREKEDKRQARQRRREYERRWQDEAYARSYANYYTQARRYPAIPAYAGPEDRAAIDQAMMPRPISRHDESENDPLNQHAHISEIDDSGASIKLEGDEEIRRMVGAWQHYDTLWNLFASRPPQPNSLRFRDIPWPTAEPLPSNTPINARTIFPYLNPDTISKFIFSPHHSQGKSDRQRMRAAFSRFQPQTISKLMAFVKDSERPLVAMGADIVHRTLVDMMDRESMSQVAIAGGEHN